MNSQTFLIKANKHTPQIVSCSTMDILLKNFPVPVVFFYRKAVEQNILIDTLQQVLSDFPIFAGTLKNINDNLSIDCNNQGVSLCVTQENLPLEQVIQDYRRLKKQDLLIKLFLKRPLPMVAP